MNRGSICRSIVRARGHERAEPLRRGERQPEGLSARRAAALRRLDHRVPRPRQHLVRRADDERRPRLRSPRLRDRRGHLLRRLLPVRDPGGTRRRALRAAALARADHDQLGPRLRADGVHDDGVAVLPAALPAGRRGSQPLSGDLRELHPALLSGRGAGAGDRGAADVAPDLGRDRRAARGLADDRLVRRARRLAGALPDRGGARGRLRRDHRVLDGGLAARGPLAVGRGEGAPDPSA